GCDQFGEKLRLLDDHLYGGGRERHASRLDGGADAGGRAKLGRVADEPVGDIDCRASALPQRQGERGSSRGAAIAIDKKRAILIGQPPFRRKLWLAQKLKPERCITDGTADIETVAAHGAAAQHRLALRQHADRGDRDGERPKRGASVAADKL